MKPGVPTELWGEDVDVTYPNLLVRLLPVSALLDDRHDDVLGGHEG